MLYLVIFVCDILFCVENCFFCGSLDIRSHSLNRLYCLACKMRYSRKSTTLLRKAIEYFALEVPALRVSKLLNKNYKTTHGLYQKIRRQIQRYNQNTPLAKLSKSFFTESKDGNHLIFLIKDNFFIYGRYFGRVIYQKDEILQVMSSKNISFLILETSTYKNYHDFKFSCGKNLNSLWLIIKRNLNSYQSISAENFDLYLNEAIFRINHKEINLQNVISKLWQKIPIIEKD